VVEPVRPSSVPAVGRKFAADARVCALVGAVIAVTTLVGTLLFAPFIVAALLIGVLIASAYWQGEATRNLHRMVVGVTPVTHRDRCPALWDAAQECAAATGTRMPRLYLFGRTVRAEAASWGMGDNASVGVQEWIVRKLPAPWVKAAVAHEFAHLWMGDIGWSTAILIGRIWARWTSTMLCVAGLCLIALGLPGASVALVVGAFGWIATVLIGIHVMPAVRYCREYAADALGVAITKDPVSAVGLMMLFSAMTNDRDVDPRPRPGKTHPPPLLRVQAIVEANIDAFFNRP
jgi:Zn-dependent protease with chaperone function